MQKYRNLVCTAVLAMAGASVIGLGIAHRVAADEVNSDVSSQVQGTQLADSAGDTRPEGRGRGPKGHQLPEFIWDELVTDGVIDQATADKIQAYWEEKQAAFAAEHPELAAAPEGERPAGRPKAGRANLEATTSTQE